MSTIMDKYDIHKSSISLIDSIPKQPVSFSVTKRDMESITTDVADIDVSSIEDLLDFAYFPKMVVWFVYPMR